MNGKTKNYLYLMIPLQILNIFSNLNDLVTKGQSLNCMVLQDFMQLPPATRCQATCSVLFKTSGKAIDSFYNEMIKEVISYRKKFLSIVDRIWFNFLSVLFLDVIVVKVIHQGLSQIQTAHS